METFKCNICEQSFPLKADLNLHIKSVHHKCSICEKQFRSTKQVKRHFLLEHEEKPSNVKSRHRPNILSRSVSTKPEDTEMIIMIEKLTHKCDTCEKSFTTKGGLLRHIQTVHENLRPHKCDVCGKQFSHAYRLTKHVKTHRHEIPKPIMHIGAFVGEEDEASETLHGSELTNQHNLSVHEGSHQDAPEAFDCKEEGGSKTDSEMELDDIDIKDELLE